MVLSKFCASISTPLLAGACLVAGLSGCSSNNNGNGGGAGGYGFGGAPLNNAGAPSGTGGTTGTAPTTTPSGGGSTGTIPSAGGTTGIGTGTGGTTGSMGGTTGSMGGTTGSMGGTTSSMGGTTSAGGATSGGGTAGSSGDPQLVDCDQNTENSSHVITQACKTFQPTPSYATKLDLGPYGAQMDANVGKGFENPDPMDNATCPSFAAIFGEDPKITNQLLDVGMQPCNATAPNADNCLDMKLYSVYRPAKWPDGKIPVLSWGNGTCAQPEGYGGLLRYIASYGFFVVAANSREVGTGGPLLKALDYAAAANMDSSSPYYGHLDMTKVGVMGHSQGSGAAGTAAADSRVQAVILYNGGTSNAKPYLAISGDLDIGNPTVGSFSSALATASKGAFMFFHNPAGMGGIRGHLVLMMTPQRLAQQSVEFWQMVLLGDTKAHDDFMAQKTSSDYDFGAKGF